MSDYPKHPLVMESEGLEKVCTYKASEGMDPAKCPHRLEKRDYSKKIKDDITDCVGNTPMVRVNNIAKAEGIKCELLAKCEFLNPGGSVKDRIGRRMVVDAIADGRIKQGDILIEPTSGNTGIGLSVAAAAKGFKMIITMPEKMSQEKRDVLKALGAEIVRTPNHYPFDHLNCHIGIAYQLNEKLPNSHILDQYKNTGNPLAHYEETGEEIWNQCEGKVDYVFMGAGTAGTLTGISRKLKEKNPNVKIIAVDPYGSILAQPEKLNEVQPKGGMYQVEGIGYDFIPRVCDRSLVDEWMKIGDEDAFDCARRLIKEEGFLCGGSSGTALAAALKYIKEHDIGEGKRCVFVCPDNIRNYITKFINNDWMYEHGFISEKECMDANVPKLVPHDVWGKDLTIKDLQLSPAMFLDSSVTCGEAIKQIKNNSFDQFPVKDSQTGELLGMVTSTVLMSKLANKKVQLTDKITDVMTKEFRRMSSSMPLSELSRVLERQKFVLVDEKFIASPYDVLDFMESHQ
jgi:cystathionine beta-synthase